MAKDTAMTLIPMKRLLRRMIAPALVPMLLIVAKPSAAANTGSPDCGSRVADEQGVTAFVSLVDGQPTDPQAPTVSLSLNRTDNVYGIQPILQIAPGTERGLCDAVLSAFVPPVQISGDHAKFGNSFGLAWEQCWQEDSSRQPTIATLLAISADWSGTSTVTNVQAMIIAAKTLGPVVLYANGSLSKAIGRGLREPVTPALTLGAKWRARADNAVVADLVMTRGSSMIAELGYQFSGPFDLDLGVGLSATFQDKTKMGFGLILQREF